MSALLQSNIALAAIKIIVYGAKYEAARAANITQPNPYRRTSPRRCADKNAAISPFLGMRARYLVASMLTLGYRNSHSRAVAPNAFLERQLIMNLQIKRLNWALSVALAGATLILGGCGGGGGGGNAGAPSGGVQPPVETPVSVAVVSGTAATGAALANGKVTITDRSGQSVCSNDPITSDAQGAYACKLTASAQAPFAIVAIDADNLVNPMISVITTKPALGQTATANVTPLTTAIAAQLDPNKDAFALAKDPASLATLNVANFNAVKANVVKQLASVLTDAGIDPATFDPVNTPFVGGNHTGVDKMLDQVRVSFDNGTPVLSNALNPNAPAVPMADANTTTPAAVSVSAVTSAFSFNELDFAKTELEKCFAVPAATRATLNASNEISSIAPECEGLIVDSAPSAAIGTAQFKNSGYLAQQYFAGLFTDATLTGAKVNAPELMRYVTKVDGKDEALLNIKYRDTNGIASNRILVAKKFPGTASATRTSNWWLYGNQRDFDVYIRSAIRQREQTIPSSVLAGTSTFNNAALSRYESALEIFVRRPSPVPGNPNAAAQLQYMRITGPGLPMAGLVYGDVSGTLPQNWMGILNATGSIPSFTTAQLAGINGGTAGNIFRLQRSQGITGTAAFTLRPNPSVGAVNPFSVDWAHPSMYGQASSATWQLNLADVPAWSLYTFEAFCGLPAVACGTSTGRILTPVMPATFAATQQWHSLTSTSKALVSDGAVATNNVDIAWTVNTLAERVGSVNAYSFGPSGSINSLSTNVPKGIFSINLLASPSGSQFPAIGVTSNTTGRTMQLRYNMLDGSYKDQLTQFN
jgi:hypothetical protein